jgi:hypothetical protein
VVASRTPRYGRPAVHLPASRFSESIRSSHERYCNALSARHNHRANSLFPSGFSSPRSADPGLALLREVAPDQRENRQDAKDAKDEGGLGPDILALRYPLFLGVLGALAVRFPVRLPAVMLAIAPLLAQSWNPYSGGSEVIAVSTARARGIQPVVWPSVSTCSML